jgi:hypothetical protein
VRTMPTGARVALLVLAWLPMPVMFFLVSNAMMPGGAIVLLVMTFVSLSIAAAVSVGFASASMRGAHQGDSLPSAALSAPLGEAQVRHLGAEVEVEGTDQLGRTTPIAPENDPGSDLGIRVKGALAALIGLALAWWQIWLPLSGVELGPFARGRAGGLLLGAAIALPIAGIACAALGRSAIRAAKGLWPRNEADVSARDVAILLAAIVPFMAIFFWVLAARSAAGGN